MSSMLFSWLCCFLHHLHDLEYEAGGAGESGTDGQDIQTRYPDTTAWSPSPPALKFFDLARFLPFLAFCFVSEGEVWRPECKGSLGNVAALELALGSHNSNFKSQIDGDHCISWFSSALRGFLPFLSFWFSGGGGAVRENIGNQAAMRDHPPALGLGVFLRSWDDRPGLP